MDEAARAYIAALTTRIAALTRARDELVAGTAGAAGSIQRLARMLRSRASTLGYAQVAEAADGVESAEPARLADRATELIAALQEIARTRTAEADQALILAVEDDTVNQTLMRRAVASPTRRFRLAPSISAAEEAMAEERPALVLLDLVLPDGDGRNFLLRLRDDADTAAIPVIVVSALESANVRSECYALGCDAYVAKPVDLDLLAATATSLLERTARRVREARVDALTGLPNRAGIRDRIGSMGTTSGGDGATVAMLDLDNFRQVNERLGVDGGDAVLRAFGTFVRAALRPSDIVGRWGGEEFVIVFPATGAASAAAALTTIQERLAVHPLSAGGNRTQHVAFTAGVAACGGRVTGADALAESERLLFHGKETGRNVVVTSTVAASAAPRTVVLAEDDPVIAALVRHRLERDEFHVEHFTNGTDALARARRGGLALVILDVNMPGISGFDLLGKLRQLPATATTPVMMLTAMGNEADIARALSLGANDYVVKPFSPVELLARVRRLVAHA